MVKLELTMNGYLLFLLIFCLINFASPKILKNKLYNEPKAFCGANEITVMFETDLPFSGNVYAKGFFDKNSCRVHGDGIGNTVNITIPITADCGMRRRRMVSRSTNKKVNPKGLVFETTVVIMFHKIFLTKADKAFHIECRYEQTNEIYTQKLEVSMLPPTDIPSVNDAGAASPKCKYEVLENNENGPQLSFAAIGQPVYHHWVCETSTADTHCLTVHSCIVDDGHGMKQELLDNDGCPTDPVLLDAIEYKSDLEAGKDSYVFKFADKPTVFFSCQLRVEPKDMDSGTCIRTSDHCSESKGNNFIDSSEDSMVTIEPDFPRPSTPRFKSTTESSMLPDLPPGLPNSSENNNNFSDEQMMMIVDDTMMPETTTMAMKRKKLKARRPPRKTLESDNENLSFPEFVGLQQDLGIRRKQPSPDAVELDVNAGAVEVIDPPEISMSDPDSTSSTRPNISIINHDLTYNKICVSREYLRNILFVSCFILLFIFSLALYLFWYFTKLPVKPASHQSSTIPSPNSSRSIRAFTEA